MELMILKDFDLKPTFRGDRYTQTMSQYPQNEAGRRNHLIPFGEKAAFRRSVGWMNILLAIGMVKSSSIRHFWVKKFPKTVKTFS